MKKKGIIIAVSVCLVISIIAGAIVYFVSQEEKYEDPWKEDAQWPELHSISALTPGETYFTNQEWTGDKKSTDIHGEPVRQSDVFAVNREKAHASDILPYDSVENAVAGAVDYDQAKSPYYQLLTGEGNPWYLTVYKSPRDAEEAGISDEFYKKDYTGVEENPYTGKNQVTSYKDADYACGWKEVTLPASWQTQGFDFPIYTNIDLPWPGAYGNPGSGTSLIPRAPEVTNPVGFYRKHFDVDPQWLENGMKVYISFQGVESAMYFYVNGYEVGYTEDSFDAHDFDITPFLNADGKDNLLAVKVLRWCDGSYLEDQDFIRLSGIFRDVFVYAAPAVHIRDYKVETDLDAEFVDADLKLSIDIRNLSDAQAGTYGLDVKLFDADGNNILYKDPWLQDVPVIESGEELSVEISRLVKAPHLWSAEDPYLYTLVISLYEKESEKLFESISQQLGFREITFTKTRVDSFYNATETPYQTVTINGKPLIIKGVNRHDTDGRTGRYISRELMETDITLMKQYNINAIRTSHYPDDRYLYYLCDKYGLYVMAEANVEAHCLAGDSDKIAEYFTDVYYDRITSNMTAQKNRTSVVMWSLGNESGSTPNSRLLQQSIQDLVRPLDSTRPVHYEGLGGGGGVDIGSNMYASVESVSSRDPSASAMPYLQCEYAHAMGNAVGNLMEYWNVYRSKENVMGGFIWDWVDQSIATPIPGLDRGNRWDYYSEIGHPYMAGQYFAYGGNWGDTINSGTFCANGLVSNDRTPQPELAEVKYVYQSIWFSASENAILAQEVTLYNELQFLSTDAYELTWELIEDGQVIQTGVISDVVAPGETATIKIPYTLPENLKPDGEYFLNLYAKLKEDTFYAQTGHVVAWEQIAIPAQITNVSGKDMASVSALSKTEEGDFLQFTGDRFTLTFDQKKGLITEYTYDGQMILSEGMTPNYQRARVDNDIDIDGNWASANRNMTVDKVSVNVSDDGKTAEVTVRHLLKNAKRSVQTTNYVIYGTGEVTVTSTLSPNAGMGNLGKFGAELEMPKGYELISWYGAGPQETYQDRQNGATIGIYQSTVSDSFYPFIMPQSTGNHTRVRYITIEDPGQPIGLMVVSSGEMEAGALHFSVSELSGKSHPYRLPETDHTILNIDCISSGLGNGSCGPGLLNQYKVVANKDYSYTYTLVPYEKNAADPMELSKVWRDVESFDTDAYNKREAANVDDLIAKVAVLTHYSQKSDVEAARKAYDALNEVQKSLVTNLAVLQEAENAIASLQDVKVYIKDQSNHSLDAAVTEGLRIVPDSSSPTQYAMKGYFTAPNPDLFNDKLSGKNAFTMEVWVNPSDLNDNNVFIAKGDTQASIQAKGGNIEFFIYDGGWHVIQAGGGLTLNAWHHIAGTYDGREMRLYLDGKSIGTNRVSVSVRTNAFDLGIGQCQENARQLRGSLAAARVYTRALSAEEVNLRYRADLGEGVSAIGPDDADVLVWYDISQAFLK